MAFINEADEEFIIDYGQNIWMLSAIFVFVRRESRIDLSMELRGLRLGNNSTVVDWFGVDQLVLDLNGLGSATSSRWNTPPVLFNFLGNGTARATNGNV